MIGSDDLNESKENDAEIESLVTLTQPMCHWVNTEDTGIGCDAVVEDDVDHGYAQLEVLIR